MESDTPRITERGVATLPGEAWELARLPGAVAGYVCQGADSSEVYVTLRALITVCMS